MIPLEDNFADIIGKAQRGLGLSDTQLAEKARVNSQTLRKLREGEFDELTVLRIAPVLGLAGRALCDLATGKWQPKPVRDVDGLAQFTTRFEDMAVNSYLVWNPKTKEAADFDTRADCGEMLKRATMENLSIKLILLTHAHGDHIAALAELKEKTGAPAFISEREKIPEAEPFEEGRSFSLGK